MNTGLLVSSALGAFTVVAAEFLRRRSYIGNEGSRKLIHTAHGVVIASWPFFTSYKFIIYAEILFIIVVLLARAFKLMQPLRNIKRRSLGEIFFPVAVIVLALYSPLTLIFAVAMLHLALADTAANLVGRYVKKGRYTVFGQEKSIPGSLAFYTVSVCITGAGIVFIPVNLPMLNVFYGLILVPAAAMLAENLSPYGSDNFTVPLVVFWLFSLV